MKQSHGGGEFLSGHGLFEHRVGVGKIVVRPQRQFDAVVAGPAAAFREVIVTAFDGAEEVFERDQFDAEALPDLIHVGTPAGGEDLHGLVGTPGGTDHRSAESGVGPVVILEFVDEVVGGAHDLHVERSGEQSLGTVGVRGQFGVDRIVDLLSGRGAELFVDAEVALEVKMDPLVHRIAGDLGEDPRHGEEFFAGRCRSRDHGFGHAALAKHLPHVVIGGGEKLPGVDVAVVVGDLFDVGMIVGIDHRQPFDAVEDRLSRSVADEVVVSEKSHFIHLLIFEKCQTLRAAQSASAARSDARSASSGRTSSRR